MKYLLIFTLLAIASCGKGSTGDRGTSGKNGTDGLNGNDGQDGVGCTVQTVVASPAAPYGGAVVICNNVSVLITNGAPGAQGSQGIQGIQGPVGPAGSYSIVDVIDPCGDAANIYDEVFLVLANGQVIWSFSDNVSGQNTRLSLATDGSFVTTDGSGCSFSISTSGTQRTFTWAGGGRIINLQ